MLFARVAVLMKESELKLNLLFYPSVINRDGNTALFYQ